MTGGQQHPQGLSVSTAAGASLLAPLRRAGRLGRPTSTTRSPRACRKEGVEVLTLAGLPPADAAGLLPGGLADAVAAWLVEGTSGNPLALLEVTRRLTSAQRRGAALCRTRCRSVAAYRRCTSRCWRDSRPRRGRRSCCLRPARTRPPLR